MASPSSTASTAARDPAILSGQLTAAIRREARRLGFSQVGVCPAVESTGISRLAEWVAAGYGGQMHYIANRLDAYAHPRHVLDGVQSIVMLTMNYRSDAPAATQPGQGRISRYAWSTGDYHDLIHDRLKELATLVHRQVPDARVRGVVDTAPLLERDLAQFAGLGWIGKHTLLLNRQAGSWFFLAALLTDQPLDYDQPQRTDHCGSCTACLDACPTDAFVAPHVLDATRCISYLTIELREPIPAELRPKLGDWLFGCDVCQDVCPWNRHSPTSELPEFQPQPQHNPVDAIELFSLSEEQFRIRFRRTPLWRPRRRGLLRNAAIVLGNHPTPKALPALIRGLSDDETLVRGACAWALGRFQEPAALEALQSRAAVEDDPEVRGEIRAACGERRT